MGYNMKTWYKRIKIANITVTIGDIADYENDQNTGFV